ncbi:MAG: NUDIX domain-containing protein [Candidatus Gracilibacteria bacterium]
MAQVAQVAQVARVARVDEKSCGIVLFHSGKLQKGQASGREAPTERKYLVLHYPGGHFDFPKGHVEDRDKDEYATAARELEEETGISDIEFIPGFRELVHYTYKKAGKPSRKQVVFFLAKTKTTVVTISFEHKNFFWLTFEEAMKKLTFKNAKQLLEKAEKFLG